MTRFDAYVGIDYSGEAERDDRVPGLEVYETRLGYQPMRRDPPTHRRWSRALLTDWLLGRFRAGERVAVGLDHGFSLPADRVRRRGPDWHTFVSGFVWPRKKLPAAVRTLLRLTEQRTSSARSVLDLRRVNGTVAWSTHAGIFELGKLRHHAHVWPFDGWELPETGPVLFEVYPSILKRRYPAPSLRTPHQLDAWAVARWLSDVDRRGDWPHYTNPPLDAAERKTAALEGWILGVT